MKTNVRFSVPPGKTVYSDDRLQVRVCSAGLRGCEEERGIVIHNDGIIIVPVKKNGDIILIRNHRWQVDERLLELPAGILESGESREECAHRELTEETGYRAAQLEPFHSFYALPGATTEVLHAYLAHELAYEGQQLQADEDIEVVIMSPASLRLALTSGEIVDSKTIAIVGLYLLRCHSD
jgi:ADP-ribose pyrophosphatase